MRRVAVGAALVVAGLVLVPAFAVELGLGVFVLCVLALLLAAAVPLALATRLVTRRKRWFDTGTLVAAPWLALVGTLGSVTIAQTVDSRAHAQRVGYGYPVHFVYADQTVLTPPSYPQVQAFDLWETPHAFSLPRFALSFLIVYVSLLALLRLPARLRPPPLRATAGRGEPIRAPAAR